jgi:hypothetical protein
VACTEAFSLLIDSNVNDNGSIASQCTDSEYISPQVSDIIINNHNLKLQDNRPIYTISNLLAQSFIGLNAPTSTKLDSNIYARYDDGQPISELEVLYTSSGFVELRVNDFISDITSFKQSWWDDNNLTTDKKIKVCVQKISSTDEQCTQVFSFIISDELVSSCESSLNLPFADTIQHIYKEYDSSSVGSLPSVY